VPKILPRRELVDASPEPAMNNVTRLSLAHLRRSPTREAPNEWGAALEVCDEAPSSTKSTTFHCMVVIQKELLNCVATIDAESAAIALQK